MIKAATRALMRMVVPARVRHQLAINLLPTPLREPIRAVLSVQRSKFSDSTFLKYNLRRCTHIVEKGLCHPKWEPGHGSRIVDETAELNERVATLVSPLDSTVRWSSEVLEEYRQTQETGINLRLAKPPAPAQREAEWLDEYLRSRRSVRSYRDQPVGTSALQQVVAAVNWCSTSCNRQTAVVYAVLGADKASSVLRNFAGFTAFSSNVPCALVFCSDLRAYTMPTEIYLPAIDVGLGMQNCALSAHSRGLSMTFLSWAQHTDKNDRDLRDLLEIPPSHQIISGAAMGYPSASLPPPARKNVDDTLVLR